MDICKYEGSMDNDGMRSPKVKILLRGYSVKDVWAKVTGMLQQNWAYIEKYENHSIIYFFDDHKCIFDRLEYGSYDLAIEGLKRNGFRHASQLGDFVKVLNSELSFSMMSMHRNVYSSGDYWIEPELDYPKPK